MKRRKLTVLTKSLIKAANAFREDWVPKEKGEIIPDPKALKWRTTEEWEVYHCAIVTGNDIQSGPIYCGQLCEYIHITEDQKKYIAVCELHYQRLMNRF